MGSSLLIFIKNPIYGKVKTRLAASIGKEKSLAIYKLLLAHTKDITENIKIEKHLFYSDFVELEDDWSNDLYNKHLQKDSQNLGEKMHAAFMDMLEKGKRKLLIIGSDCLDLETEIIEYGFELLDHKEAVIGQAKDGGYYSLGLNLEKYDSETCSNILNHLFLNKSWSHEQVAQEAKATFRLYGLSYEILPVLSDIDIEADLEQMSGRNISILAL